MNLSSKIGQYKNSMAIVALMIMSNNSSSVLYSHEIIPNVWQLINFVGRHRAILLTRIPVTTICLTLSYRVPIDWVTSSRDLSRENLSSMCLRSDIFIHQYRLIITLTGNGAYSATSRMNEIRDVFSRALW